MITGRPARQVVGSAAWSAVARRGSRAGGELLVLGQYGNERWDSATARVHLAAAAARAAGAPRRAPRGCSRPAAPRARSSRRRASRSRCTPAGCPTPPGPSSGWRRRWRDAAERHGLVLEPGRLVLEVRAPGMHKGLAVRAALAGAPRRRRAVRRRRPRRPRGVRGGRRPAREGLPDAAGLLGLARSSRRWPSWPTSWSTAPPACWRCSAGSPPTLAPLGPEPTAAPGAGQSGSRRRRGRPAARTGCARRVAAAQPGPAGREQVERHHRQAEAGDVLPGVPLLVRAAAAAAARARPGRAG